MVRDAFVGALAVVVGAQARRATSFQSLAWTSRFEDWHHDALLPLGGPRGLVYAMVFSSSRSDHPYPLPW